MVLRGMLRVGLFTLWRHLTRCVMKSVSSTASWVGVACDFQSNSFVFSRRCSGWQKLLRFSRCLSCRLPFFFFVPSVTRSNLGDILLLFSSIFLFCGMLSLLLLSTFSLCLTPLTYSERLHHCVCLFGNFVYDVTDPFSFLLCSLFLCYFFLLLFLFPHSFLRFPRSPLSPSSPSSPPSPAFPPSPLLLSLLLFLFFLLPIHGVTSLTERSADSHVFLVSVCAPVCSCPLKTGVACEVLRSLPLHSSWAVLRPPTSTATSSRSSQCHALGL